MLFKVLEPGMEPSKGHRDDAGYDLKSRENVIIYPGETVKFGSGVCVWIPSNHVGEVRPRSSTSQKGLIIPIGTIDHGYTGEIGIIIANTSNYVQRIKKGERVAQLVVVPCLIDDIEVVDELPRSERGAAGFGSTGV